MKKVTILITLSLLLIWGCGDDKATSPTPVVDTAPPQIISTTPVDAAVDVSFQEDIIFYFNEPIDDDVNCKMTIDPSIDIQIVWGDTSITFSHLAFDPSTNYTIVLDSVFDLAGNMLSNPDTLSFTSIHEQTPPTVALTFPTDNSQYVSVDTSIHMIFSEPLDPQAVSLSSVIITPPPPVGNLSYANQIISFYPNGNWSYNTQYNITITTDITDTLGNHLEEEYEFTFTTTQKPLAGYNFEGTYKYITDYGLPTQNVEEFPADFDFRDGTFSMTFWHPNYCSAGGDYIQINNYIDFSLSFVDCDDSNNAIKLPVGRFTYQIIGNSLRLEMIDGTVKIEFNGS